MGFTEVQFLIHGERDIGWNYVNTSDWANMYESCAGNSQSPINIDTASVSIKNCLFKSMKK